MRRSFAVSLRPLSAFAFSLVFLVATASAQAGRSYSTIYNFTGGSVASPMFMDNSGNIYGSTLSTSTSGATIFKLMPHPNGVWTNKMLYTFTGQLSGLNVSTTLLWDGTNFFGGLYSGGISSDCPFSTGCGLIFELSPDSTGAYKETTLYTFGTAANDGASPVALAGTDTAGDLYGVTQFGGAYGWGTVFELSPQAGGGWTEKILHNFGQSTNAGKSPTNSFTFETNSITGPPTFMGTTTYGGPANSKCPLGCGTVFQLTSNGSKWTLQDMHVFQGQDGAFPAGQMALDFDGNIYGTADLGGAHNAGVVYELTPNGSGGWNFRIAHAFNGTSGGRTPHSGLLWDPISQIFTGTTMEGGKNNAACPGVSGCGVVYRLIPQSTGSPLFFVLHYFDGTDGYFPTMPVSGGNPFLFGATELGGSGGAGTVFLVHFF